MLIRAATVVAALTVTLTVAPSAAAPTTPATQPTGTTATAATPTTTPTTTTVARSASSNPLAHRPWGVYQGNAEPAWAPYERAHGKRKRLLAKIALRPKAKWFGAWTGGPGEIGDKVRDYVASSTAQDPDALVQMTVFRMVPWEAEVDDRLPTRKERRSYRAWIDAFAAAVGNETHAAIILQPDGPLALKAPHGSRVPSRLIAYAARRFGALDHTATYLDAGASDWPAGQPELAATILQRAGVDAVRGFALNATHYTSTADNIAYGTQVVEELARRGIAGKHFVVDTAENGRPFLFGQYRGSHPNNAKVCQTKQERRCVTLGIPPTWHVGAKKWQLPAAQRRQARQHVDGYLWFGRPWLHMQTAPFSMARALPMARTTPW